MANNTRTKAKKRSRAEDKEEEAAVIFEEQVSLLRLKIMFRTKNNQLNQMNIMFY